jgi:energy-coupling factor transporter ATP-binding protein EcfA2
MAMTQRILIMGLPGSGKTTLAGALKRYLEEHGDITYARALQELINPQVEVNWFNADDIRRKYNDWDFSNDGRIRQSIRMFQFSMEAGGDYVICDFVAPLVEMRNNFKADWTIWVDTIREGRYADTNALFQEPEQFDFRVTEQDAEKWAEFIGEHIVANRRRPVFNWQKETVQMLGRWQPWHEGHRALFERAIAKTGQVMIQIRDCQGWQGSNPFAIAQVKSYICRDLDPIYQGQYEIQVVPNIVNITYGRDVGYRIEQEIFDDSVTNISATKIRKELGLK